MMKKDTKELRFLINVSKKVLSKRSLMHLKKVKNREEKIEVMKYAIKAALELRFDNLRERIIEMEKKKKDVFFAKTKEHLLNSKIRLFTATFHKKDFNKVLDLFKDIEKELKNV